jgi:hypothetical protein
LPRPATLVRSLTGSARTLITTGPMFFILDDPIAELPSNNRNGTPLGFCGRPPNHTGCRVTSQVSCALPLDAAL